MFMKSIMRTQYHYCNYYLVVIYITITLEHCICMFCIAVQTTTLIINLLILSEKKMLLVPLLLLYNLLILLLNIMASITRTQFMHIIYLRQCLPVLIYEQLTIIQYLHTSLVHLLYKYIQFPCMYFFI